MSTSSNASRVDTLVGLNRAKLCVNRLLGGECGAHAVLFYGAEGCGKRALAMTLAKAWLCPKADSDGACGVCGVCKSFDAGRAVDFQLIEPAGKSAVIRGGAVTDKRGSEDEEGLVPIIEFFRTAPLMARHKVVLLDQADRMNAAAANAFLKTLEEPRPYAKILMVTSELSRMLPTVRSRCMAVACELPSKEEMDGLLGEGTDIERIYGEGAPGMALRVRQHKNAYGKLHESFEQTLTEPSGAALKVAEACRDAADALSKSTGLGSRAAHVETARALAAWLTARRPDRPDLAARAVGAHRLLQGNASAPLVFDALFCRLMEHH